MAARLVLLVETDSARWIATLLQVSSSSLLSVLGLEAMGPQCYINATSTQ